MILHSLVFLTSLLWIAGQPPQGGAMSTTATPAESGSNFGVQWNTGPTGTVDPGLLDRGGSAASDQTVGPLQRGGEDGAQGFTILGTDLYSDDEDFGPVVPEFHIVAPGDTLWAITSDYYRDPYQWPRVWALNEQITNANWIFPGDRVRVREGDAAVNAPVTNVAPGVEYVESKKAAPPPESYLVQRSHFLVDKDAQKLGKIVGGDRSSVMLSVGDDVYLSYDKDNPPVPGERLAVYYPTKVLRDRRVRSDGSMGWGKKIGYLVEIVAEVEVGKLESKSASARVVDARRAVERGMWVGELEPRYLKIRAEKSAVDRSGNVVEVLDERTIGGEGQLVVVNIGAQDGARRGNVIRVVRRGDEYAPINRDAQANRPGHPQRIVAEMVVVDTTDEASLTMVVESRREIAFGDNVELGGPGDSKQIIDSRAQAQVSVQMR